MAKAKIGDTVKVHYTGKLKDGSIFDSSINKTPLEFKIGDKTLLLDFENAVIGMDLEESKIINIIAEKAYGKIREDLIASISKKDFPPHITPQAGLQLQIKNNENQTLLVTITSVTDDMVTIDANHPLAGEDLIFEIKLVEIN
ncbi:TPA: peptidylprolyl isomerase [Candidatus Dependentiae bacterium]|nr:MAG: Peptidyl-prolyl cis-trans isomerase [candidate division TM6 bacterium GW2011_GWE2_31_21]KKP54061.1 MAG: Peptidyl-prolyl cis-trans isomerase [candidate division TM6 bacterium GW2011_GWF2_33_332]HBS48357.1 peptidylprolyl isomerase [Candidatus Dependentiae bacterium]HBZ72969.1 peptidylprolyl isomerase [Candidatus Dependentiae bacterium]